MQVPPFVGDGRHFGFRGILTHCPSACSSSHAFFASHTHMPLGPESTGGGGGGAGTTGLSGGGGGGFATTAGGGDGGGGGFATTGGGGGGIGLLRLTLGLFRPRGKKT